MKKLTFILVSLLIGIYAAAQQNNIRTAYFLDNYSYGYRMNPAFAPTHNFISIPLLGNISFGLESNLALADFLYPTSDGKLALFIDDSVSSEEFLGKLDEKNALNTSFELTLMALGFKTGKLYHTLDFSLKAGQNALLPKSLFSFIKVGTENGATSWDIRNTGLNLSAYGECAYGLSTSIGESLRVGARVKVLLGLAQVRLLIEQLDIDMNEQKWTAATDGSLEFSGPLHFGNDMDLSAFELEQYNGLSGLGFGVDLGATYDFLDMFTASVSLLDLGVCSWKNTTFATGGSQYEFGGFGNIESGEELQGKLNGLGEELGKLVQFNKSGTGTSRKGLAATLHAGLEARMPFYDALSFGLLGTQRFNGAYSLTEGRISANLTPVRCLGLSASCGISNYGKSFGGILNLNFPGLSLFLGVDSFLPFMNMTPQLIPIDTMNTSVALGFNITFGK